MGSIFKNPHTMSKNAGDYQKQANKCSYQQFNAGSDQFSFTRGERGVLESQTIHPNRLPSILAEGKSNLTERPFARRTPTSPAGTQFLGNNTCRMGPRHRLEGQTEPEMQKL